MSFCIINPLFSSFLKMARYLKQIIFPKFWTISALMHILMFSNNSSSWEVLQSSLWVKIVSWWRSIHWICIPCVLIFHFPQGFKLRFITPYLLKSIGNSDLFYLWLSLSDQFISISFNVTKYCYTYTFGKLHTCWSSWWSNYSFMLVFYLHETETINLFNSVELFLKIKKIIKNILKP